MAGGGSPTPSKGGKKNVDFTVNLVPTIDLLSVLIAFLLITAVWTQLARINAQQVLPKTSDKPQEQTEEKKEKKLLILIDPRGDSGRLHRRSAERPEEGGRRLHRAAARKGEGDR